MIRLKCCPSIVRHYHSVWRLYLILQETGLPAHKETLACQEIVLLYESFEFGRSRVREARKSFTWPCADTFKPPSNLLRNFHVHFNMRKTEALPGLCLSPGRRCTEVLGGVNGNVFTFAPREEKETKQVGRGKQRREGYF